MLVVILSLLARALAILDDQAYIVDWHLQPLGTPVDACKVANGTVLLSNTNRLSFVDDAGQIAWQRQAQASQVAADDRSIYTVGDVLSARSLDTGLLRWSVDIPANAVCVGPHGLALAHDSTVVVIGTEKLASSEFNAPSGVDRRVKLPGAVTSLDCSGSDVVAITDEGAFAIIADNFRKIEAAAPSSALSKAGVAVDGNGNVHTSQWALNEVQGPIEDAEFLTVPVEQPDEDTPKDTSAIGKWRARLERHTQELFGSLSKVFAPHAASLSKDTMFGYDQVLVVLSKQGTVYALDTTHNGTILWQQEGVYGDSVDAVDHVAVISRNGEPVASFSIDGQPAAIPPVQHSTYEFKIDKDGVKGLANGIQTFEYPGSFIASAQRDPRDSTANLGTVLGESQVLYKYINPNVLALASHDGSTLTVTLLDTVSGKVLHRGQTTDVIISDAYPFNLVMGEHWIVYTYYSADDMLLPKLTVWDFYESMSPVRVSNASTDAYTDQVPRVAKQTFLLPEAVQGLEVSRTRFGATVRAVLVATASKVYMLPKNYISALRPVDRDPTPGEKDAGLSTYKPLLSIPAPAVLSHERQLAGINKLVVAPTHLESTYLLAAFGDSDIFFTRASPSSEFDKLPESFGKRNLLIMLAVSAIVAVVIRPFTWQKELREQWL